KAARRVFFLTDAGEHPLSQPPGPGLPGRRIITRAFARPADLPGGRFDDGTCRDARCCADLSHSRRGVALEVVTDQDIRLFLRNPSSAVRFAALDVPGGLAICGYAASLLALDLATPTQELVDRGPKGGLVPHL